MCFLMLTVIYNSRSLLITSWRLSPGLYFSFHPYFCYNMSALWYPKIISSSLISCSILSSLLTVLPSKSQPHVSHSEHQVLTSEFVCSIPTLLKFPTSSCGKSRMPSPPPCRSSHVLPLPWSGFTYYWSFIRMTHLEMPFTRVIFIPAYFSGKSPTLVIPNNLPVLGVSAWETEFAKVKYMTMLLRLWFPYKL